MIHIRPFNYSDQDYAIKVALDNAAWPDLPQTVEESRHSDESWDRKYAFARFIAEENGHPVAYGTYLEPFWSYRPGKYFLDITVDPRKQRRGIGTTFLHYLIAEVEARGATNLTAYTREDKHQARAFLEKFGFERGLREPISELDVTAFDPAAFADRVAQVEASGIRLASLAELAAEEPDWVRKFSDMTHIIEQDVPSSDPPEKPSYESSRKWLTGPRVDLNALLVAVDGDTWVGTSMLILRLADPTTMSTGLTGILRSHRRRGIATALKVRAIEYAQTLGVKAIQTENEENNPMFQLNLQLGYKPKPAWLEYNCLLAVEPENAIGHEVKA